MRISDFLHADFVLPRLESRDVEGVLHELAAGADGAGFGAAELIADKLLERERQYPTVLGSGLAIPHATVPGLEQPVIGIAVASPPIQFGPDELEPVSLFFVLLSPPGEESRHVKLLARICRLGRDATLVDRVAGAEHGAEMLRVIESIDAEHV